MMKLWKSARPQMQLTMAKAASAQPSKVATAMARRTYFPAARASASSRNCWGVSWIAVGGMAAISKIIDHWQGAVAERKNARLRRCGDVLLSQIRSGRVKQVLEKHSMHAMPLMIGILCCLAIAYRYYSAFIAAKVVALSDSAITPAERLNDGQNYHPTNKWVLFGHHFAAISGAGPLIGPVLAAQFGYLPGLLWIVIGVCLGGAVQDFLVLVASTRRDGKSLAQIAYTDIGKVAGTAGTIAILFIIVIALAGLGKVVVKALGGEAVKYPAGSIIELRQAPDNLGNGNFAIPAGTRLYWNESKSSIDFNEAFQIHTAKGISAAN